MEGGLRRAVEVNTAYLRRSLSGRHFHEEHESRSLLCIEETSEYILERILGVFTTLTLFPDIHCGMDGHGSVGTLFSKFGLF